MQSFDEQISGRELWAWRSQAIAEAQTHDIDPVEVDWLLRGLCEITPLALRLATLEPALAVPARVTLDHLQARWQTRVEQRVPIQHLVGQTPWRELTLRVSPAVLIPRPETELIIDIAVSLAAQSPQSAALMRGTWVDLGTGSGAIALGLARAFPAATIVAVDVSAAALEIAQQNAVENGVSDRVQFFQGSWFEPLAAYQGKLAGMVSNPPYIPRAIVPTLEPEVAEHEPHLALDGGNDGLDCIRCLIDTAPRYLIPGGIWLVEHMIDQAPAILNLLTATGDYSQPQSRSDLTGRDRFVLAYRR
jgi:release factor glutamine methyltransferase